MRRTNLRLALALAAVVPLVAAVPASAADDPPTDNPAIAVYIEQVPTSKGPVAAGRQNKGGKGLAPSAREKVRQQGGQDAAALEEIATSPNYGAPAAADGQAPGTKTTKPKAAAKAKPNATPQARPQPRSSGSRAVAATPTAAADADRGFDFGLAALGLALTLATIAVVTAVRRRRSRLPRTP